LRFARSPTQQVLQRAKRNQPTTDNAKHEQTFLSHPRH
jgi:hypothetical protein